MNLNHIILIPLIPLAVFLILGLFYNKIRPAVSGYVGVLGLLISTSLAFYSAYNYFFVIGKTEGVYQTIPNKK